LFTDEQYNIRYASSTVETIFGVKPVSILGRNGFRFCAGGKATTVGANVLNQANGNQSGEITLLTNNGDEVHFDVTVTNHIDHDEIMAWWCLCTTSPSGA